MNEKLQKKSLLVQNNLQAENQSSALLNMKHQRKRCIVMCGNSINSGQKTHDICLLFKFFTFHSL